jgi:hypothetical protein
MRELQLPAALWPGEGSYSEHATRKRVDIIGFRLTTEQHFVAQGLGHAGRKSGFPMRDVREAPATVRDGAWPRLQQPRRH